jgi:hypothetical protein
MSNVRFVDLLRTLDSMGKDDEIQVWKAVQLLDFHKYLKRKRLWTLEQQMLFVKKIIDKIIEYIQYDKIRSLKISSLVLELHIRSGMLDLDKLVEKEYNPLTYFLKDCEKSLIHEQPRAGEFVDFLLEIGDEQINKNVFHDINEVCRSEYLRLDI